jgi:hypothetical protein
MSAVEGKAALSSKAYDVDDFVAAQELFHSNGWTDGLPIVPPTEAAVQACLDWALMPPDQLIGIEPVREQPITAETVDHSFMICRGAGWRAFPQRRFPGSPWDRWTTHS